MGIFWFKGVNIVRKKLDNRTHFTSTYALLLAVRDANSLGQDEKKLTVAQISFFWRGGWMRALSEGAASGKVFLFKKTLPSHVL